jgi:hypothetical protein
MKNNNQRTWIIIGVIVAIVVLFFIFRKNNDEKMEYGSNDNKSTEQSTQTKSTDTKTSTSGEKMETGEFTIEGTLQVSDNPSKGNIKIVGTDKTTYLLTKQDYSSLYGKQVVLKAYGTSTKFTFESLTEKK